MSDTATSAVFQWMIGLDMAINERWTATTDYRMWITSDMKIDFADGTTLKGRHTVHTMSVGIRYALGD